MYLFKPIEVEIKTGWTKTELISKLEHVARFTNDSFELKTNLIGYDYLSQANGTIGISGDWTLVSFKIFPSIFVNLFASVWYLMTATATINFLIRSLIDMEYKSETHYCSGFFIIGFLVTQVAFNSSANDRERKVRQALKR
jgi:hypothetical protein